MLVPPWQFAIENGSGFVPVNQDGLALLPLGMASSDEKTVSGWIGRKEISLGLVLGPLCLVDAAPEERSWLEGMGLGDFSVVGGRLMRLARCGLEESVVRALGRDVNIRSEGFVLWDTSFCEADPLPGLPESLMAIRLP